MFRYRVALGVRLSWFPVFGLLAWASEARYTVSHPDLPVAERVLMARASARAEAPVGQAALASGRGAGSG